MKWVEGAIESMLKGIAENALLDGVIANNITDHYGLLDANGFVSKVIEALSPIGYAMCLLFFILAINDLATQERLEFETFFKFFTKLFLGVACIVFSKELVEFGWGISVWSGEVLLNIDTADAVALNPQVASGASGLLLLFTVGIIALLLQIAFGIVAACISIACFSRVIELMLRACFMPVAMALVVEDGMHGAGGRYLKRFCAVCLQGPAMLLISKIHSAIVSAPIEEFCAKGISSGGQLLSSVAPLLGVSFATVALCFKSSSIVNDVFGA